MSLKHIILPILIICLLLSGCTQEGDKSDTEPLEDISASETSGEEETIEIQSIIEGIGGMAGEDNAEADTDTSPKEASDADTSAKPPVKDGDGSGFKPGLGDGFPKEGMTLPEGFSKEGMNLPEGFEKGTLPNGENWKNRPAGKFPGGENRQPPTADSSEEPTDQTESETN